MSRFAPCLAALVLACGCLGSGDRGGPSQNQPAPAAKPPTENDGRSIAAFGASLPPSPAAESGLEIARGWALADWEDPGRISQMAVVAQGRTLMCVTTSGGEKGKSAAVLSHDMALAEKGALRVAAFNPGPTAVQVAVAFWFSDGWVYYESTPQSLPGGAWKMLSFDLAAADYKTQSSEWKHSAALWKREDAKRLGLLVFGSGKPASVYFDGLAVDTAPQPAAKPDPKPTAPPPPPPPAPPEKKGPPAPEAKKPEFTYPER